MNRTNDIIVRPAIESDLDLLYDLNQASVPEVGSVTHPEFTQLVAELADVVLVASDGDSAIGFVLCMVEGTDYGSLNYQWFAQRNDAFAYVDRVAVAHSARGLGVGGLLYDAVVDLYAGQRPVLTAEVNLQPPNPGSLKFHRRHGFVEIGERWEDDRSKGVVYLARSLSASISK